MVTIEKLFQYEINNRAFAFQSISVLRDKMASTGQAEFWQAYYDLETFNKPRYEKMAASYNLVANDFVVGFKVWATNLAFALFPEKMMAVMTEATVKYVEKLKQLAQLVKKEDREFFEYVIQQEQAQAEALIQAEKGEYAQAAKVLNDFLVQVKFPD
ncbi:MAG: hypothetical protein GKR93_15665 [Gammaproteobacteria bacterium]|nr:hypothetical protein [Gammaproteobacteria bacterium]